MAVPTEKDALIPSNTALVGCAVITGGVTTASVTCRCWTEPLLRLLKKNRIGICPGNKIACRRL